MGFRSMSRCNHPYSLIKAAEARLTADTKEDPEKLKKLNEELWHAAYDTPHSCSAPIPKILIRW